MDNLTFGDIFKIFPRLPSVKTPEVNRKIIVPSGITPLKNADQFRVIYKEGKQLLRTKPWVNGEFVDVRNDQFPLERLSITFILSLNSAINKLYHERHFEKN